MLHRCRENQVLFVSWNISWIHQLTSIVPLSFLSSFGTQRLTTGEDTKDRPLEMTRMSMILDYRVEQNRTKVCYKSAERGQQKNWNFVKPQKKKSGDRTQPRLGSQTCPVSQHEQWHHAVSFYTPKRAIFRICSFQCEFPFMAAVSFPEFLKSQPKSALTIQGSLKTYISYGNEDSRYYK